MNRREFIAGTAAALVLTGTGADPFRKQLLRFHGKPFLASRDRAGSGVWWTEHGQSPELPAHWEPGARLRERNVVWHGRVPLQITKVETFANGRQRFHTRRVRLGSA